jgi:hypothetical protein
MLGIGGDMSTLKLSPTSAGRNSSRRTSAREETRGNRCNRGRERAEILALGEGPLALTQRGFKEPIGY